MNEISMPVVALRGLTILPEMVVHFDVSRERSIAAIQQSMLSMRLWKRRDRNSF